MQFPKTGITFNTEIINPANEALTTCFQDGL